MKNATTAPPETTRVVVVGAGISGLAAARAIERGARESGQPLELEVWEAAARPGGKIHSERDGDFLFEWGPNGFLDSKPSTLALTHAVGLESHLLASDDAARKRYLLSRGVLHRLPESPGAFLKSRLLSWPGKLRVLMEPFARQRPSERDETVEEFATRRLGRQAAQRLIDPMVSGVFAGDPRTLSLAAAFPRIAELERDYGGLFRALRSIARERRRAAAEGEVTVPVGPGPGGRLTSFLGGLEELPAAIAAGLGARLRLGVPVIAIERTTDGGARYRLRNAMGHEHQADVVVLAIPAYESARLLKSALAGPLSPAARGAMERTTEVLDAIPYSRLAVVALGYEAAGLGHDLDGFGFLIPREERRSLLGALWTSSIFPGRRAAAGKALITCMVGGARQGHLLDREDAELIALVREELRHAMGITAVPLVARAHRHEKAIPGYPPGHPARVVGAEEALQAHWPGILLAGNAYRGIGVNDCTANAERVAQAALSCGRVAGRIPDEGKD